jgi:hypothetical protein
VILTLDGGGVRGLVQLGLLRALESRIGIPIASLPDLCIGTSVGTSYFYEVKREYHPVSWHTQSSVISGGFSNCKQWGKNRDR